jgi:hypothetical protein
VAARTQAAMKAGSENQEDASITIYSNWVATAGAPLLERARPALASPDLVARSPRRLHAAPLAAIWNNRRSTHPIARLLKRLSAKLDGPAPSVIRLAHHWLPMLL